ncbi:MAG: Gfo/Idh/MocA family oxidoreductase [Candidatus Solibacter sp.]|nr:Gfo/Idh/MocA family oxidoreductase [Candidatus Solibacter sp.]
MKPDTNRRKFVGIAAASGLFSIVPRHVLGGQGYVPPSDKITMAHIGCGTEGTRELVTGLIQDPQVQIVAVCDPVKNATNYLDWSKNGIRDSVRRLLDEPGFNEGVPGIRGGRDQFQQIVQKYYAKARGLKDFKVASYADFRELLEKEKDIDAVKIMTPDHLHATIGVAAMNKGKNILVHKPLANRMNETKLIMETARKTKVATHFLAFQGGGASVERIVARIKDGAIGPLREVHNWTDRPVWPQYTELPTERPPVPEGFDWNLWLGPERDRPYHPNYTHMVFRSWYDFGGGCIADVGIYSLWPVFTALQVAAPVSARAWSTHTCNTVDHVANPMVNDFSFPTASVIQFQYAARPDWPALDLFWYDGGVQPRIPELDSDPAPVGPGGMLWVGDKGKILTGGRGAPQLITAKGVEPLWKEETPTAGRAQGGARPMGAANVWTSAFKGGEPSPGNFLNAGPISETVCLAAVALRAGRVKSGVRVYPAPIKLLYDSASMKITNLPEANKYLSRDYRPGWEL